MKVFKNIAAFALGLFFMMSVPMPAHAQDIENRFWISQETISRGIDNCRKNDCPKSSHFTTRLFNPNDRDHLRRMMSLLDFQAAASGNPIEHPETPQFCARQLPPADEMTWNPEWMRMSDKLESLRGLQGLYVNVRGLKGPRGFVGDFGPSLQAELERQFSAAGIRIVSKEEVLKVPGQPKLNVYFSNTNPETGCWWSVFATLTQTAVLTRDINVKINAGTWSFMKGYDPANQQVEEYDTIVEVFKTFADDFRKANDDYFKPTNVPPYISINGTLMMPPSVQVKSYDDIVRDGDFDGVDLKAAFEGAIDETVNKAVETGFTPEATKPELSPKALRRLNLEVSDVGNAEALEKVTIAGGTQE